MRKQNPIVMGARESYGKENPIVMGARESYGKENPIVMGTRESYGKEKTHCHGGKGIICERKNPLSLGQGNSVTMKTLSFVIRDI